MDNDWVYNVPIPKKDIGVIVFDGGKKYAVKQRTVAEIKNELDFCHRAHFSNEDEKNQDNLVYLYRHDKYRSPPSGNSTTMILSLYSGRMATCRAA